MPTPNLDLPLLAADQAQKHVTVNEALLDLDALVQLAALDRDLASPPASPTQGARYLVAANPTGNWAGHANEIAVWLDGAWRFFVPGVGWVAWVIDEGVWLAWSGSAWVNALAAISAFQNLAFLGVRTTADANNRLAVKSNGVLLSHDDVTPGTGDLRVTLNKSAAAKDAGFVFQDGFGTRALFGLLGDDNFTIKVSPDGSTFRTAIIIDKTTGHIGVNCAPDATNRLAINADGVFFNKDATGDMRLTLNKSAANKDVGFIFQDNFGTRALFGLLGDDDFLLKVSPDGSAFFNAFRVFNFCGRADLRDSARRRYMEWFPNVNTTTLNANGLTAIVTGTATAAALSSTSLFTQSPRLIFASAATAGSSAGINGAQNAVWRGSSSDRGGFFLLMRFGWEVTQAQGRCFAGLRNGLTAIGNVNPSTLTEIIGVGFDSGQTSLRLLRNDASGVASVVDLGVNFPGNSAQEFYELMLSAEPGDSGITYRVERLNTGHVATGTLSTDLPTASTFLTPHLWGNNGTTAAAVQIALHTMYLENASLYGSRGF